jgi:hypothetical protein
MQISSFSINSPLQKFAFVLICTNIDVSYLHQMSAHCRKILQTFAIFCKLPQTFKKSLDLQKRYYAIVCESLQIYVSKSLQTFENH